MNVRAGLKRKAASHDILPAEKKRMIEGSAPQVCNDVVLADIGNTKPSVACNNARTCGNTNLLPSEQAGCCALTAENITLPISQEDKSKTKDPKG